MPRRVAGIGWALSHPGRRLGGMATTEPDSQTRQLEALTKALEGFMARCFCNGSVPQPDGWRCDECVAALAALGRTDEYMAALAAGEY